MSDASTSDEQKIEVRELPGRGRGVVAARLIEAGESVVAEAPFAWVPRDRYHRTVCYCHAP